MRKFLSNIIIFTIILGLFATSGLESLKHDFIVSMAAEPIFSEEETSESATKFKQNLAVFTEAFDVKSIDAEVFQSRSMYFSGRTALADDLEWGVSVGNMTYSINDLKNGQVVEIYSDRQRCEMLIKSESGQWDGNRSGYTFSYSVDTQGGAQVLEVEAAADPLGAILKRLGPGEATINVLVTGNNYVNTFSFVARVGFKVDKTKKPAGQTGDISDWVEFSDGTKYLVMYYDPYQTNPAADEYALKFMYFSGTDQGLPITFSDSKSLTANYNGKTSVAEFDMKPVTSVDPISGATVINGYTPTIKAIGAGFVKLTLNTNAAASRDEYQSDSFYVIVVPRGMCDPDETPGTDTDGDGYSNEYVSKTVHYVANDAENFALYVNGLASNLEWKAQKMFYRGENDANGQEEYAFAEDTSGQAGETILVSPTDGKVIINNICAGTYKITAELKDNIITDKLYTTIEYVVYVKPSINTRDEIILNISDSYKLINQDNSNIVANSVNEIFTWSVTDDTIISADTTSGIVKALAVGKSDVVLTYKQRGDHLLYPYTLRNEMFGPSGAWTVTYKFQVINNLTISNSLTTNGGTRYRLTVGETGYKLYAKAVVEGVDVKWKISDETYIKFEGEPLGNSVTITALKPTEDGKPVIVTAYQELKDGSVKTANCYVEVVDEITKVELGPSTAVTKGPDEEGVPVYELNISKGDFRRVRITAPSSAADPDASKLMTWIVADRTVATLSADGSEEELAVGKGSAFNVNGLKPGITSVTIVNSVNNVVCAKLVVHVLADSNDIIITDSAKNVYTNGSEFSMNMANSTEYQFYAFANNEDITSDDNLVWELAPVGAQAEESITLNKGYLVAKAPGTTLVTVKYNDVIVISFTIKIVKDVHVSAFKMDTTDTIEIYVGEVKRINFTITPDNVNQEFLGITTEVFDPSIASVSKHDDTYNGYIEISGTSVGTTYVEVAANDTILGHFSQRVKVIVKRKASSVTMNYKEITIAVGQYFDMPVTVSPADATEKSITWTSLQPNIATVSSSGRITGVAVGTATILAQAGEGPVSYCTVTVQSNLVGISITPETATIGTGETLTFKATFDPVDATNKEVTWSSSNPAVATVNPAGMVEGLRGGYTVISAVSVDGGYTAFALLKVDEPVYKIEIDPEEYILGINKSFEITATITNRDTALNTDLIFTSVDPSIATVDKAGKVTGRKLGETQILVESADGEAQAICRVEVVREVQSIKLNYSTQTVLVGNSFALKATVTPSNAAYTDVNFEADDPSVVIVDEDGIVTGLKPGTTFVRATAKDNSGKYALCYVTVINPVSASKVTSSEAELTMFPGETKTITISMAPYNTTDTLSYSSSNDAVATVSSVKNNNGPIAATIRAVGVGEANITFTTSSGKSTQVRIIVLGLSRTYVELPVYTTYATLVVDGATGPIRWDVSDPTICDVENGVITARKVGTTTVLATVNGRTLKCTVKVTPKE